MLVLRNITRFTYSQFLRKFSIKHEKYKHLHEQILQTCKNIEKREKHRCELYNKFVENVKYRTYDHLDMKIMLYDLVEKYSLKSIDILEGLYLYGSENLIVCLIYQILELLGKQVILMMIYAMP